MKKYPLTTGAKHGGQMRKRGQKVTLKHINTGKVVKTKIILADSKQGYLAELIDKPYGRWVWYPPTLWEEVK